MSSDCIEKVEGGKSGDCFLRHLNGDVQLGVGHVSLENISM